MTVNGESIQETTLLAFDFGTKRIGVAVGNTLVRIAHPLITIDTELTEKRFMTIAQLLDTWKPNLLLVGLPMHSDGTPHELTRLCQRFARRLQGRFGVEVVLYDERYTSKTASVALREAGITGRNQKAMLDQVAAQHILQSYLDEQYVIARR